MPDRFIQNFNQLATSESRKVVLELMETAYDAIQPHNALKRNVSLDGSTLNISTKQFNLDDFERVYLVGFGKGSAGIASLIENILGERLTGGWVIDASEAPLQKIAFTLGNHPLPSQANLDFTKYIIDNLSSLTEKDLVIVLTCGGGSAMFEYPVSLDLDGIIGVNKALLKSGATISEMNAVRKHVSQVKGGGLAKVLFPATIANLLFSDVPGNDLAVIASGPTVKDPSTIEDALIVFEKYNLAEKTGLTREAFTETPKDDKYFAKLHNLLILSNRTALEAMQQKAEDLGYAAEIFSDKFQGEAKLAGATLLEAAKPGSILLAGGETTVTIEGEAGEGGRNQEVVLGVLSRLQAGDVLTSFASDGWDNTPVAGALGDESTISKAAEHDIKPDDYLQRHDSLAFFTTVADTVQTGRLASNVADLYIVLKGKSKKD
jgi:glycerate 2-kinase